MLQRCNSLSTSSRKHLYSHWNSLRLHQRATKSESRTVCRRLKMSTASSNPFVWDRPFAFLWLTSDEKNATQEILAAQIREVAQLTRANFAARAEPINDQSSIPFFPHVTLHTTQLDPSDVTGSLEKTIRKTAEISASLTSGVPSPANVNVHLTGPVSGATHFKSVYLDVAPDSENIAVLHKLKESAKNVFGPNVPPEEVYLPHLSLWYGNEPDLRKFAHSTLCTGPTASGIAIFPLSHLHLVYAPFQDVRSWRIIGTSRLGYDVFIRRTAFIGGKFDAERHAEETVASRSLDLIPVINPANGIPLAYMEGCQGEEAERAIAAAQEAFKTWSVTSVAHRAALLNKLAEKIREKADYLTKLETTDNGKPLKEAAADINDTADCFAYYAKLAESDERLNGKSNGVIQTPLDDSLSCRIDYEPVGPCGMILPFNYPMLMAAWKLAPSLAAGCTVVLKPSEITSVTALEMAALMREVGVPEGVVNVLPGFGPQVGPAITSSPHLRKIAFTGSGNTGKHILKESTRYLPNVTLELGGKSPLIVFEDADLPKALDWLLMGIFFNAGQVCSATSRLIVHSKVYDQVKDMLVKAAGQLTERVGDGRDPRTLMGPLVSLQQYQRVKNMVAQGLQQGATMLIGEKNYSSAAPLNGFFFFPTILENVSDDNTLWKDEVFGPVLVLRKFESEEEAIKQANATRYGLAAAIFTSSPSTARRVTRQLEAGIVWENCSQPTLVQAPWGGMKESGIGRELGPWGLDNFLEPKQVTSWTAKDNWAWYGDL